MRSRSVFLLSVGTCGAGFLVAFFLFRSSRTEALDPVHAAQDSRLQSVDSSARQAAPEPPDLERADSRVPALTQRPLEVEAAPSASATTPSTSNAKDEPPDPRTLPELTLEDMTRKREAIQHLLNDRAQPFLHQRFQDGLSDHVSDEQKWSGIEPETERAQIYGILMTPGRGTDRTVLPRDEYPELYALKDETLRLDKLIRAEQNKRAEQAVATPR